MTGSSRAELTLRVDESLVRDVDFVGVRADVQCRGFSGHTSFTIARRDLHRFMSDAAGLASDASDLASLRGGWNDVEDHLRLELARTRRAGPFVARIRLATTGPRADQWNRVQTEFVVPASAIGTFVDALSRLVTDERAPHASLVGDAEVVA